MTAKEILDAANQEYPDGYLSAYYDNQGRQKKGSGDLLAEFIVSEILEKLADVGPADDCTRLNAVQDAIDTALRDLEAVAESLEVLHDKIHENISAESLCDDYLEDDEL